jgi:Ca2+-binding RTX toxin-like protein
LICIIFNSLSKTLRATKGEIEMAIINGTPGDDNAQFGGSNLIGTSEDDDIFGFAGNDLLNGGAGNDFLLGGQGNDDLNGQQGNDFLEGGAGNDFLGGGAGDNVLNGGDGDDTVGIFLSFVEVAGTNALDGGAGNDLLLGESGTDVLNGGAGNDSLEGSFGFNTLIGGSGNDSYLIVQNPGSSGNDVVVEAANGGIDTIETTLNIILPANVENLTMRLSTNGTGNELNNSITGTEFSGGRAILSGLDGNDTITGGRISNDILAGGNGNDILTGRGGSDLLLGGAGADRFRFFAPDEGVDIIADFVAKDDSIRVSAAGFGGGLTAGGAISAAQFRLGSIAADASDRFIYNNNGALFFDVDGAGGAGQVQIATLIGAPTITTADIITI